MATKKHDWMLRFEVNMEYSGYTSIEARRLRQLDDFSVIADGVKITIDERIQYIEKDGVVQESELLER